MHKPGCTSPKDESPRPQPRTGRFFYCNENRLTHASLLKQGVACSNVITGGFDVVLSDNESHHFSLTTQDQLNLITVTTLMASGETSIPYHADGELCKFYSPDDMTIISTGATNFKTYHVSYFNSLKSYIESLNDIETISAITYGFEIPSEYMSDVLKVLVSQAGSE